MTHANSIQSFSAPGGLWEATVLQRYYYWLSAVLRRSRVLATTKHAARDGVTIVVIAAALSVIGVASIAGVTATGVSAAPIAGGVTTPNQAKTGTLLLKTEQAGRYVEAPRLGADFNITVNGPIARATLTQRFVNPTEGWVEAVYVFPLPEMSAVDTLRMVVGKRVIVGEIKERKKARIIYERAKANGQKAALIEQQRPNIFTHNVANIGPGEAVVLQLEYQQTVKLSGDKFSLRVPLVVAPRFSPEPVVQTVDFNPNGEGWGQVVDPVPDRDKITSPVLDPRKNQPVNPVTLKITLNPGFELGDVISPHHKIKHITDEETANKAVLTLDSGAVPANRDFELTWQGKAGALPSVGLFRETIGDADYVLAFVTPPKLKAQQVPPRMARDVTFIIDTSGSMGGQSIVQARNALQTALSRLKPEDRFNIIRFSSDYQVMNRGLIAASASNIARAQGYVSSLEARGGTMMVPPLQAALAEQASAAMSNDDATSGASRLGQVIFLTDGAIGNEQQLFEVLTNGRGRSRIFMVGIGSAPNSFLMTRAAELGRGTFTHIGSEAQVADRMSALFEKLENPSVTNLNATFKNVAADVTPGILPDLYFGEPLVVAAKLKNSSSNLVIKGMIGPNPWTVTLPISNAISASGVSKLWARRKIADAEVDKILHPKSFDQVDQKITSLALEHHLVSRVTSLVAIDKTPSRPEIAKLTRADVPLNLPEGWDFDKVFGEQGGIVPTRDQRADAGAILAPRATPLSPIQRQGFNNSHQVGQAMLTNAAFRDVRFAKIAKAAAPVKMVAGYKQTATQVILPQTATDAELRLLFGFFALLLAAMIAAWSWWLPGNRGELA